MKHVLFALLIAIAALSVGCQDMNMTGPVAAPSHQLQKPTPNTGSFQLKGDVSTNPEGLPGNSMTFHVDGVVSYEYRFFGEGIETTMEFQINTQASVVAGNPIVPPGTIDNQSIYQIPLANKTGVIFVQREYFVTNLGAKLHVVFGIDEDNTFSVASMSIDMPPSEGVALKH